MPDKPVVMISSTARDLPDYRAQVMDACHRCDMFPRMMEHLPALPTDAINASLALVDEANVYVGVFAHRYGYVPEGYDVSITEMEYERAINRGIPRLIFLMHDDVPVLPKDFEKGEAAEKLEKLKERLKKVQVVAFFNNPDDLRAHVLQSLVSVQKQLDTARSDEAGQPTPAALAGSIHYVSEIPQPPEPYIAHPYTLLQVRRLVGRKEEMELLTDWVTGKRFDDVRIFNVVAIGGMGKSALTWTWFNDVAPQEMLPLAGRIWWSFYESDATFENFVTRALGYVSGRPLDEVKKLALPEQEDQLLRILDRKPFLIALDGLERILIAYARHDSAYLSDDAVGRSPQEKHKLRKTADLRVGRFLRQLAGMRESRVIISTRLYPAELEGPSGEPSPGSYALALKGLSDPDALALWRAYGAKGSRERMLPIFETFGKHPLLVQLLAYEVAEFREAPGDFDAWQAANSNFNPFGLEIANVQTHVLEHALRGLSPAELRAMHVIAGFRMPASMNTLKALLIQGNEADDRAQKPFATLNDLDAALTALEDRGLLGWDRRANRYDLHPIVRGVVWTSLDNKIRFDLYDIFRRHFEEMPPIDNYEEVEKIEDLTPATELYNTLIRLKSYDEAFEVFRNRISRAMQFRLSANRLRVELLEALFPSGANMTPALSQVGAQRSALSALAASYLLSGHPGAAVLLFQLVIEIIERMEDRQSHATNLRNLCASLYWSGMLRAAEAAVGRALTIDREQEHLFAEGVSLDLLARIQSRRGASRKGATAIYRAIRIWQKLGEQTAEGVASAVLAELSLWRGDSSTARELANRGWAFAAVRRFERDFISAARLQGTTALHRGSYTIASERLSHALVRARAVSLVEEELPTLVALAELRRQKGEAAEARAMLEDVWDAAERGPYPLFHADALNVLAQIERDAGNTEAAVEAATKAYQLAWCDGPPFAYHWGLEKAKAHLAALGAPEPEMPPFDESQHEPMPEVEINPPDEFGGDGDEEFAESDEGDGAE